MNQTLHTKYGNAKQRTDGYYCITSSKEGNNGKLLHRLIAADYFGDWINDTSNFFHIHHIDENKSNNCVLNLEPLSEFDHKSHHSYGKPKSIETKKKISQANKGNPSWIKGKHHTEETKKKISETQRGTVFSEKRRRNMSEAHKGNRLPEETKIKLSLSKNSTGYFRVTKNKYRNGFSWRYYYYEEDGTKKSISSIDIGVLEEKVKAKGLPWFKLSDSEVEA